MSSHIKTFRLYDICHYVTNALKISDGEFWVWYGSPFILQLHSHK